LLSSGREGPGVPCRLNVVYEKKGPRMAALPQKRRLNSQQRRALELLAREPPGITYDLLVIAHGLETKMLAGLIHEKLAEAMIGEPAENDSRAIEVVRITITDDGRKAIED
jgi:hypothetical protein